MTVPLISHLNGQDPFAYYEGRLVTAQEYLEDVYALASALPHGKHVLNLCSNRYKFLVGFGASIISNAASLLPSSITTETLNQLRAFAQDFFVIADHVTSIYPSEYIDPSGLIGGRGHKAFNVPEIDENQVVAYVFTSGSTGVPIPHEKLWGSLAKNVHIALKALEISPGTSVVGTTPSQHMYGFESNALLCLHGRTILYDDKPFFPADIAQALEAISSPRFLVTTPFHLEKLLESGVRLPNIDRILCATAPLSQDLAQRAETVLDSELSEIFGSTETGQIATRRTSQTDEWTLLGDIKISKHSEGFTASGEHLLAPITLMDMVEISGQRSFRLVGRNKDMVNIAGKRSSLGYLNSILKQVPGVIDGIFFIPTAAASSHQRLALAYTSASIAPHELQKELRRYIDPVFLPRPLLRVDEIPRNPTGKVLQCTLDKLIASQRDHES